MSKRDKERRVELAVSLNLRQAEALRALRLPSTEAEWLANDADPQTIDVLYGGGKMGGKSWLLCLFTYAYALEVIRFFDLPVSDDVPHIGWIGRKIQKVFVATTLTDTWIPTIPAECFKLVPGSEKHPLHIRIADRVAIDYGGLDSRQDLERFNSAEYGFVGIDQAEETSRDDVATLLASRRKRLYHKRLKRLISLPYRGLLTANPRTGWLKEDFIDNPTRRRVFIKALYRDNPHGPANYATTLQDSFGHRPDLLKAYRDGDWSALSGVDQIILQEWVTAAKTRAVRCPYLKRWVSVDPARFGDDSCVILGGENTDIIAAKVLPYCSEPQIVTAAESLAVQMGDGSYSDSGHQRRIPIIVEVVGVCGVGDYLAEHGRSVVQYSPAGKMSDAGMDLYYYNPRSRSWGTVAKWLAAGAFDASGGIFTLREPQNPELLPIWQAVCDQLCWPWYEFRGQKILVASKEDIKAKHSGVSPDYGDAYVNGVVHLPAIPVFATRGGYRHSNPYEESGYDYRPPRPKSPMAF